MYLADLSRQPVTMRLKIQLSQSGLLITLAVLLAVTEASDCHAQEAHERSEHNFHRNTLSLFLGVTLEDDQRERSIGLEYERRMTESFGLGVTAERTGGERYTWIYVAPVAYHAGRWKLYLAPGIEDSDRGSETLWRVGAEYGFEAAGWEISPQIDLDFVDDREVVVFGIAFGRGF